MLPIARPAGVYAGIGVMMMLPILLLAAGVGMVASAVVTGMIARRTGLGRWSTLVACVMSACLSFAAAFYGFDSPWTQPRPSFDIEAMEARSAERAHIAERSGPLLAAIDRRDLEPLRAALDAGDAALTPPRLMCIAFMHMRTTYGRAGTYPSQDGGQAYLHALAELAWQADTTEAGRRAIGLLAIDGALRDGRASELQHWLERGVSVSRVYWPRDVDEQTEPVDRCIAPRHWPFELISHSRYDTAEKITLLLKHGFVPDDDMGASLLAMAPLPAATVQALIATDMRADAVASNAPLTTAIWMATEVDESGEGRSFRYDDATLIEYIDALIAAGAHPHDPPRYERNAWQVLGEARARLQSLQEQATASAQAPQTQQAGTTTRTWPEGLDLTRTTLMQRIEQSLRAAPTRPDTQEASGQPPAS
ncbi:hypothetical protein ACILG0_17140 [Pseudomonadota bacterium AL_CKDN230030165-1A_HGKHYDSX7]